MEMLIPKTRVYNGKKVKVWVPNPAVSREKAYKTLRKLLADAVKNKSKKASA